MDSGKKMESGGNDDQVDQLLQAAQDELKLKLSVDSHMSRVSPNYLDSDLDRRFRALRSRPSSTSRVPPPHHSKIHSDSSPNPLAIENPSIDGESKSVIGDDLAARFAVLKASLPCSASPPSVDDEDEDDEVEKLIQWAKDAARLDPSPSSDEDDEDEDNSSDEDVYDRRKERMAKKKT